MPTEITMINIIFRRSLASIIRKKLILTVLPGVDEVRAKSFLSTNILINDDLPTLLLPINANSGKMPLGQPAVLDAAIC
jgi:hypothetical protein